MLSPQEFLGIGIGDFRKICSIALTSVRDVDFSRMKHGCHQPCSLRLLCQGGGKRAWYVLLATLKLSQLLFTCWKATLQVYTPCETCTGDFKVRNNITLMATVLIASLEVISELQREKLRQSHVTVFSWMDKYVDNFHKQRAEYLHRSFIIVHTMRLQNL